MAPFIWWGGWSSVLCVLLSPEPDSHRLWGGLILLFGLCEAPVHPSHSLSFETSFSVEWPRKFSWGIWVDGDAYSQLFGKSKMRAELYPCIQWLFLTITTAEALWMNWGSGGHCKVEAACHLPAWPGNGCSAGPALSALTLPSSMEKHEPSQLISFNPFYFPYL